jgi:hypothetical protein
MLLLLCSARASFPTFVDRLLDQGRSLRGVASAIRKSFDINMSYESVRTCKLFRERGTMPEPKQTDVTFIVVKRIRKKSR